MSSVTVRVNNKEYKLKGDEREEYLHAVATYVDKKIKNIMENNSKLSTAEASILTALNLADDLFKAGYYNEELSDEIEKLKIT
ncbi:cell division protein ZapA [Clostridium pasteurianum]|uniref:cell division protein ZapA n=1 Tax=Clostridium pasteurianum TaxID=1501 RepID=UPI001FA93B79|nr:cell division protein ZapA [Clostridium pasteurianum]